MTLNVPFRPQIALAQYKLKIRLTFKKNIITTCFNFVSALIITVFTWEWLDHHQYIGYFFLACGAFILFNAVSYLIHYSKLIKKMRRLHQTISEVREQNRDIRVWEFRDDALRVKDIYYDDCISWKAFRGYRMVEGNLLLMLKESVNQYLILGANEISPQEFADVVSLLKTKMPLVSE